MGKHPCQFTGWNDGTGCRRQVECRSIPLLLLAIAGLILSVVMHRMTAKKYNARSVSPIEGFKQAI